MDRDKRDRLRKFVSEAQAHGLGIYKRMKIADVLDLLDSADEADRLRPVAEVQVAQPPVHVNPQSALCDHSAAIVEFDNEAAQTLDVQEIRRRWPRWHKPCPACGTKLIKYASFEHYIMGDW